MHRADAMKHDESGNQKKRASKNIAGIAGSIDCFNSFSPRMHRDECKELQGFHADFRINISLEGKREIIRIADFVQSVRILIMQRCVKYLKRNISFMIFNRQNKPLSKF